MYLTVSTTQSGRTSKYIGINQGHNIDPAYPVWFKRLGVNAVRLFGGDPAGATLPSFYGTGSGRSLSGIPVKNYTSWKRAVAELRWGGSQEGVFPPCVAQAPTLSSES